MLSPTGQKNHGHSKLRDEDGTARTMRILMFAFGGLVGLTHAARIVAHAFGTEIPASQFRPTSDPIAFIASAALAYRVGRKVSARRACRSMRPARRKGAWRPAAVLRRPRGWDIMQ